MSIFTNTILANKYIDPLNTPLTLTAQEAGSTVSLAGSTLLDNVYYRTNHWSIWHKYTAGDVLILENVGDYVQFWNNADRISEYNNLARFTLTGKVAASGNLQSLNNWSLTIGGRFESLFDGQTALTSAPLLPATHIFSGGGQYYRTFRDTSITEIDVWLQTMNQSTMNAMCWNCKQLEKATIRTTNTYQYSHYALFYNCPKLREIAIYNTSWGGTTSGCFVSWAYNLPKTGTIYIPKALPIEYNTDRRLPYGWCVKTHEELADTTKWRNFAKDPISIPLGFAPATLYNIDYEVELEFEIFDSSKGATVLAIGSQPSPYHSTSLTLYGDSDTHGYSYVWYNWGFDGGSRIAASVVGPTGWEGMNTRWWLPYKSHISKAGRHRATMRVEGNTVTYNWNGRGTAYEITRNPSSGLSTNTALTFSPNINGRIYKFTIKDLTNNTVLLDVPKSYLALNWTDSDEFTPVEYLQSVSGVRQWIDTGIVFDQTKDFYIHARTANVTNSRSIVCGSHYPGYACANLEWHNNAVPRGYVAASNTSDLKGSSMSLGVIYDMALDYSPTLGTVKFSCGDQVKTAAITTNTAVAYSSQRLFSDLRVDSVASEISNPVRIYDVQIKKDGELVLDLIPVLDSAGVPCMYDKVSKTLLYNRGAGTFEYGAVITS